MSENMIPRISVPDIQDSLTVSNALISFAGTLSESPVTVESYVRAMRRITDLLEALSEEANRSIALRDFGLTPDDLENVDKHASDLREIIDGPGENR